MNIRLLHATNGTSVPASQVLKLRYNCTEGPRPESQATMGAAFGVHAATWSRWESSGIPEGPTAKLFRLLRSQINLNREE